MLFEVLPETHAVQVLHHEVRPHVGFDAEVDDADNIRVVEHRAHTRLRHEPASYGRGVIGLGLNHLDGDDVTQAGAARTVDFAHPANADAVLDFVASVDHVTAPEEPHARRSGER